MLIRDLFSVLFPSYCPNCGCILSEKEPFLCVSCLSQLSENEVITTENNLLLAQFYGQCDFFAAACLFYFEKNSAVQKLIHELKYHSKEEIGNWLGQWLGEKIIQLPDFQQIDAVIPVPLHKKKLKIRGYNQVALFAQKLAQILNAKYIDDVLIKEKANSTQTKKDIWKRFNDSKDIFSVQNPQKLEGKTILLVDDLITTGATIESCYKHLSNIKNIKIGVAAMAYTLRKM